MGSSAFIPAGIYRAGIVGHGPPPPLQARPASGAAAASAMAASTAARRRRVFVFDIRFTSLRRAVGVGSTLEGGAHGALRGG